MRSGSRCVLSSQETSPDTPSTKMILSVSRSLFTTGLALWGGVSARQSVVRDDAWPQNVDLDSFVLTERTIALQGALDNIGPNGSEVAGASAGFVVASPSKANPNCGSPGMKNMPMKSITTKQDYRLLYLDS